MFLARVIGSVVSTIKDKNLEGKKLMIIQPVKPDGKEYGTDMIAVDLVDAGAGDTVIINKEGSSARLIFGNERIPLQAVIVGVVDRLELGGTVK